MLCRPYLTADWLDCIIRLHWLHFDSLLFLQMVVDTKDQENYMVSIVITKWTGEDL